MTSAMTDYSMQYNQHTLAGTFAAFFQREKSFYGCKRASKSASQERIFKFFLQRLIKKIKAPDTQATTDNNADKKYFTAGRRYITPDTRDSFVAINPPLWQCPERNLL